MRRSSASELARAAAVAPLISGSPEFGRAALLAVPVLAAGESRGAGPSALVRRPAGSWTGAMAATATVPAHLQPVIERAGGLDVRRVRGVIAGRLPAIPRLRQRLVRVPFGCGGPVWADDPRFHIGRHVCAVRCPGPGDEIGRAHV